MFYVEPGQGEHGLWIIINIVDSECSEEACLSYKDKTFFNW